MDAPAIDRAALADALTAASVGPHPPPIDRLRAAAEYVIDRSGADQIILFGSAARGEFNEDSDFDFLAVRPGGMPGGRLTDSARWTHPETGDEIDILFEDPGPLPERRWAGGTVYAAIFAEGSTVYTADGTEGIPTLRDEGLEAGEMVKREKYDRGAALDLARRGRTHLSNADNSVSPGNEDWPTGCKELQESTERTLKAVIVAAGSPFEHTHDLGKLWRAAEELGERLPGERDEAVLQEISLYGAAAGCNSKFAGADPETTFRKFRPTAEAIAEYAKNRVPELLDKLRPGAADASNRGALRPTPKLRNRRLLLRPC